MSVQNRIKLAMFAGFIAVNAYAGMVGLITGGIDFGQDVNARLPFGSTVFAGIALALVVGVPMTVAAHLAGTDRPHFPGAAVLAGVLLVGWIAVEVAFIRSFSWLQPVCLVAGLVVAMAGVRELRRTSLSGVR